MCPTKKKKIYIIYNILTVYANLYLGGWKRHLFSRDDNLTSLNDVISWHRFIEDVLLIWGRNREELMEFMEALDQNKFNMKFTVDCNQSSVTFLDVQIFINTDNTLGSSLYRKPTAGNTILHASSAHPQSLISSIPYSQYLRIWRNCTGDDDFEQKARDLQTRLHHRAYSPKCLKKAYNRAKNQSGS